MNNSDTSKLENLEESDFDNAEIYRPNERKRRAVVSVAFSSEDFERVARAARGMKTSEFIRNAALEKINPRGGSAQFTPGGVAEASVMANLEIGPDTQGTTLISGDEGQLIISNIKP
jgi:hypothetical protein